jgi:FdhE protein
MITVRERIEALRRETPSFGGWLSALEIALEIPDPVWDDAARSAHFEMSDGEPALSRAAFSVDAQAAARLLDRLLDAAAEGPDDGARTLRGAARSPALDAPRAIVAAIRQDRATLDEMAARIGASPEAFAPIADLAALPLLQAFGRLLAHLADGWPHGRCPICAAWPLLAETRGPDRARHMRCGRCAADWVLAPFVCPYCGNDDPEKIASLVLETGGDAFSVEACDACQGYVKTLARSAPIPAELLPLEDLTTVELDLAAIERGYHRPGS